MRNLVAIVLVVLGAALATVGAPALYVRSELLDRDQLTERIGHAVEAEQVRDVAARRIVAALVDAGAADVLVVRPLLEPAVAAFLGSPPAEALIRIAARDAFDVLVAGRASSLVLDLGHGATLVTDALRSVSPRLATSIPASAAPEVWRIPTEQPAVATVRELAGLRRVAFVPALLALACFAGALAVAVDRRAALVWCGGALAAAGALIVLVTGLGRRRALAEGGSGDQPALGAVWDALLGDLRVWGLGLVAIGAALAVAILLADEQASVRARLAAAARHALRPPSRPLRALRGGALLLGGVAVVVVPALVAQLAAVALAGTLAVLGLMDLIEALERQRDVTAAERRARPLAIAVSALAVTGVVIVVAALVTGERPARAQVAELERAAATGCLGSPALCDLRLNEVTFAGTHNSFSAAARPGWLFPNQDQGIERQLRDGIRLFLLDVHEGAPGTRRVVRTNLAAAGISRNRVAKALSPEALALADRLAGRVGGEIGGSVGEFLCHTLCELGSEPALASLEAIDSFLDRHPGELVVLFFEPYVAAARIESLMRRSGLLDRVATLERDAPLPTLGELIGAGRQVIVFTERDGGARPWYHDGFEFVADTPLGARSPAELSCDRYRGTRDSPLLALNHWIDDFPPRPSSNARIAGARLLERVRACERRRRQRVNLIAVDFYGASGVVAVAARRNREAVAGR